MKFSYELVGGAKERHSEPIYCIAWSKDIHIVHEEEENGIINELGDLGKSEESVDKLQTCPESRKYCRYMATCGSNHLTLYEVYEKNNRSKLDSQRNKSQSIIGNKTGFRARQAYVDVDEEETFYSCLFVGNGVGTSHGYGPISLHSGDKCSRTNPTPSTINCQVSDLALNDGPQLCCVAGSRGVIKVIDTTLLHCRLTLSGHGNEIYDMSVCPHNPWLLLSASKDESLRLWNVQHAQCIAIFSGHEGHRDAVLSVDWHPLSKAFVSSGMDETIKIWSLEGDQVRKAIESDEQNGTCRTVYEQLPLFSTSMIHTNYVDCVQFVGDLILSKSTTNTIALWKPELALVQPTNQVSLSTTITQPPKCIDKFLHLCDFDCTDCDVWYVRFGTNSTRTMLAIGNNAGDLRLFHIDSNQYFNLMNLHCSATIRHVSFTPDDKSIIAVCDDSTIWKWDIEY